MPRDVGRRARGLSRRRTVARRCASAESLSQPERICDAWRGVCSKPRWQITWALPSFAGMMRVSAAARQPLPALRLQQVLRAAGLRNGGHFAAPLAHRRHGSIWAAVEECPPDPILGLVAAFLEDPSPSKVNLAQGAYRTEEGDPLLLSAVKKAEARVVAAGSSKEYLGKFTRIPRYPHAAFPIPAAGQQRLRHLAHHLNPPLNQPLYQLLNRPQASKACQSS